MAVKDLFCTKDIRTTAGSKILENFVQFFDEIVFRFIGKWFGNEDWNLKINDLPEGLIQVKSPVTYVDSLVEISNSDLLLVIDAPFTSSVFFVVRRCCIKSKS